MADLALLLNPPRPPHGPIPDTVPALQAYARGLLGEIRELNAANIRLRVDLATSRARWEQLLAAAQDADRMGHGIDVPSFMRGVGAGGGP